MDPNRPLGDDDYSDGEIHPLVAGSELDTAIRTEVWLNWSEDIQAKWLRLINKPSVVFLGTVISAPRRQVELTIILQLEHYPERRWSTSVIISLNDFDRFLRPDPA